MQWKDGSLGKLELFAPLPKNAKEVSQWIEVAQDGINQMANAICEGRHITDNQSVKIGVLDKRTKVMNAILVRLSEADRQKQRKALETTLEMKGLYYREGKRVATPEERDRCFGWIAHKIGIDYDKVVKTHGKPVTGTQKFKASDKTKMTFESVEDMKQWKRFINTANTKGKGIQLWDSTGQVLVGTQLYWMDVIAEADRIAGLPLKACFLCLFEFEAFWDEYGNCSLREIPNEGKIVERTNGELIIQIFTDCQATPPRQEIYMHAIAEGCIAQYWKEKWALV